MVIIYSILAAAGTLAALSAVHDYREKKREQEFRTKFDERWSKYFEGVEISEKETRQANCCYNCKHSEPSNPYIYDGSSICTIDMESVMDYETCNELEKKEVVE